MSSSTRTAVSSSGNNDSVPSPTAKVNNGTTTGTTSTTTAAAKEKEREFWEGEESFVCFGREFVIIALASIGLTLILLCVLVICCFRRQRNRSELELNSKMQFVKRNFPSHATDVDTKQDVAATAGPQSPNSSPLKPSRSWRAKKGQGQPASRSASPTLGEKEKQASPPGSFRLDPAPTPANRSWRKLQGQVRKEKSGVAWLGSAAPPALAGPEKEASTPHQQTQDPYSPTTERRAALSQLRVDPVVRKPSPEVMEVESIGSSRSNSFS